MKIMKKALLLIIIFCSYLVVGQTNNRFYASIDDYKNNKPIEGYEIVEKSMKSGLGNESFEIKHNGTTEKIKISKFPSALYMYEKNLLRRKDAFSYYVLISGPICYYLLYRDVALYIENNEFVLKLGTTLDDVNANGTGGVDNSRIPYDYYSESITGEISELTNKKLKKMLEQKGLLEEYNNDKLVINRESSPHKTKEVYASKKVNRFAKYIRKLNEKLK